MRSTDYFIIACCIAGYAWHPYFFNMAVGFCLGSAIGIFIVWRMECAKEKQRFDQMMDRIKSLTDEN